MTKKLTPVEMRINKARKWPDRIEALLKKKRKKDHNYSEAEFCRKHDFDYGFFNRNKNLRVVPSQKTVDAIEKALKKEKV